MNCIQSINARGGEERLLEDNEHGNEWMAELLTLFSTAGGEEEPRAAANLLSSANIAAKNSLLPSFTSKAHTYVPVFKQHDGNVFPSRFAHQHTDLLYSSGDMTSIACLQHGPAVPLQLTDQFTPQQTVLSQNGFLSSQQISPISLPEPVPHASLEEPMMLSSGAFVVSAGANCSMPISFSKTQSNAKRKWINVQEGSVSDSQQSTLSNNSSNNNRYCMDSSVATGAVSSDGEAEQKR
jgi:hypothetical protein